MSNNKHNSNLSCAFAERLVAVLYDEADDIEKSDLEAHLSDCRECHQEFTAFAAVRSNLGEWRETAFSPLDLPAFDLPQTSTGISPTNENPSWFDRLREICAVPNLRLRGAAAFAVLAICAALVFVFNSGSRLADEAAVKSLPKVEQTISETPVASKNQADETVIAENQKPPAAPEKIVAQLSPKSKSENTKAAAKKVSEPRNNETIDVPRRSPVAPQKKPAVQNEDFDELLPTEIEEDLPSLTDLLDEVTPAA